MNNCEDYVDALDHIMRVANASRTQTRRLRWIAERARTSLEGGDWREVDLPKMSGPQQNLASLQARVARLQEKCQQFHACMQAMACELASEYYGSHSEEIELDKDEFLFQCWHEFVPEKYRELVTPPRYPW